MDFLNSVEIIAISYGIAAVSVIAFLCLYEIIWGGYSQRRCSCVDCKCKDEHEENLGI